MRSAPRPALLLAVALALAAAPPAAALWSLARVTPQNQADFGFRVEAAKSPRDGLVAFTVTRATKDRPAQDRTAQLTLTGEGGPTLVADLRLEPAEDAVAWRFRLAASAAAGARLEVREQRAVEGPAARLPRGGQMYEFRLGDFLPAP